MSEPDRMERLLTEIRDAQRELTAEYRRVANEALALQRQSFEIQQQAVAEQRKSIAAQVQYGRIYRVSIIVLLPVIGFVLWLIVRLVARMQLF